MILPSRKLVNIRGELFATIFCHGMMAIIRLGSSLILTRFLQPEAYGTITIILSIAFVVELLADTNASLFIIRDENAEQPEYLNTAWTLQFTRSVINCLVLLTCAPFIAQNVYGMPSIAAPLRAYSFSFLITGLQSISFPLAIRRKQARFVMYAELCATLLSTCFSVIYCYHHRNYWGIIYGMLLNRVVTCFISYRIYPEVKARLQFNLPAAKAILGFTRFTMPSSLLTLAVSQFDKVIFLRLFDLRLMGVYGLAGNIAQSVEALISRISQMVLYPRCAHTFRANPGELRSLFYTENAKLFLAIIFVPAAIGGAAQLVITVLYPTGYAEAGSVLRAFMLRALLLAFAAPSEDLLIATGEYRVILHGNVIRAFAVVATSLGGYYFGGFMGFVYGASLSGLPTLAYYLWLQRSKGLIVARYEVYKVGVAMIVALASYLIGAQLLSHLTLFHLNG